MEKLRREYIIRPKLPMTHAIISKYIGVLINRYIQLIIL